MLLRSDSASERQRVANAVDLELAAEKAAVRSESLGLDTLAIEWAVLPDHREGAVGRLCDRRGPLVLGRIRIDLKLRSGG